MNSKWTPQDRQTDHQLQRDFDFVPITWLATCFHTGILLILFDTEDGGDMFLQEVG
jgi:hypothetical protein